MTKEVQQLRTLLQAAYDRVSVQVYVGPAFLANEVMAEMDPEKVTPALVYMAAHLELRQIARSICRERFETEEDPAYGPHSLFPDLQIRYPTVPSGDEPVYCLLEHLTEADVKYNVARLRKEAGAKMKHADALDAWWDEKLRRVAV